MRSRHMTAIAVVLLTSTAAAARQDRAGDPAAFNGARVLAADPAVAYNPHRDEYLVARLGPAGSDAAHQVVAVQLDGTTGETAGAARRVSAMSRSARRPVAAYSSVQNEYLVAWIGSHDDGRQGPSESEVFVQRIDAATGREIGADDLRVSSMGGLGRAGFFVSDLTVTYSERENEYLLAWTGEDDRDGQVDDESEVFVQRIDAATGREAGADDRRISAVGGLGDPSYGASGRLGMAYDPERNCYLVAWAGDAGGGGAGRGEVEIFIQMIDGATGAELGADDRRVSSTGPEASPHSGAFEPSVAYNPRAGEFLVVWHGDEIDGDFQIFSQRIDAATGQEIGADDAQLTTLPDGALEPAVRYSPQGDRYAVTFKTFDWQGGFGAATYGLWVSPDGRPDEPLTRLDDLGIAEIDLAGLPAEDRPGSRGLNALYVPVLGLLAVLGGLVRSIITYGPPAVL